MKDNQDLNILIKIVIFSNLAGQFINYVKDKKWLKHSKVSLG